MRRRFVGQVLPEVESSRDAHSHAGNYDWWEKLEQASRRVVKSVPSAAPAILESTAWESALDYKGIRERETFAYYAARAFIDWNCSWRSVPACELMEGEVKGRWEETP